MKILAIRLKNLASIEGTFEVDFQKEPLRTAGIFAISGPTGAGKSTILDALCLALYDKTPRFAASGENLYLTDIGDSQINQSDVKNILRRGMGEGFAEVDFLGATGHRYCSRWFVRRARSKPTGSLQAQTMQVIDLDTDEELQGTKTELLNQLVTLVGLTYEQFTRTVLLAQNDFATFLKSREAAKAELLEKLTGTEIYSRISKEIYARYKEADQDWNQLKNAVSLIELLPDEEWQALQAEKKQLTENRDKGVKQLAELNAQLNIIRSLKIQQEFLVKKQEEEIREEAKRKLLQESLLKQTVQFERFKEQWEALQPDLRKARELDVKIQSATNVYKAAEQSWQLAGKQTVGQQEKVKSALEALQVTFKELEAFTRIQTDDAGLLLVSSEELLGKKEEELAEMQKENDERVIRLNAYGIRSLGEEQNRLIQKENHLQAARQQMNEWLKAEQEVVRLETSLTELVAKQKNLRQEGKNFEEQLSVKEAQHKTLQRLYENARMAMSKDILALRSHLHEGEACPVCGSTAHPYSMEEKAADVIYQDIEHQYREAVEDLQKLNNRNITLKQEIRHWAEQQEQTEKQLLLVKKEAVQKCPQHEEEKKQEYFDREFQQINEKRNELSGKLQEYDSLYKEWKQKDEQVQKLRAHCGEIREHVGKCRLLLQESTSAREQLNVFKRAEATELIRFQAVTQELEALRNERKSLLKGKAVDEAEAAVVKREKELLETLEIARKEVEKAQASLAGLQGEMKQLNLNIRDLENQSKRIEQAEQLPGLITACQSANQETVRQLSVIEARLLQQIQNKAKLESIAKELKEKQSVAERWSKLNKLVGSADGTKFKVIAQSYTLNLLLMHANKHLSYLSKRYKLQQVPGTLALQVIDCDMCDEVRTVYSLSGGESFLISLALALGLSSLSSNNLKVESLFIDEGFGSLDADSLRTAMEALEQLQMQGRKIGVISHVQEMSERIAVQVQLHKAVNGKSTITVVG